MNGSNRTKAAKDPAPEHASITAVSADREWNAPMVGFAPKWVLIAAATFVMSATNVGMEWFSRALAAFWPWLRKS